VFFSSFPSSFVFFLTFLIPFNACSCHIFFFGAKGVSFSFRKTGGLIKNISSFYPSFSHTLSGGRGIHSRGVMKGDDELFGHVSRARAHRTVTSVYTPTSFACN